jgi:hypothetical protein
MNWRKPISVDRGLAVVIPMGVLLAWVAAVGPMWIDDVRVARWPRFGSSHSVVTLISGIVGGACGLLSAPIVILCLTCRPFRKAVMVVYTPPVIAAFIGAVLTDDEQVSLAGVILPVAGTPVVPSTFAWFALPAVKQRQASSAPPPPL